MAIYIIDGYSGHGKTVFAVRRMRDLIDSGERIFSDIKLFPEFMKLKMSYVKRGRFKYDRVPLNIEGLLANKADRDNPNKKILYWSHFDEWQYLKSGTILCDEGGVKFNARRFDQLPDEIQNKLMQLRHERLDLYLTAPHQSRIDLMIRQNTERFYHCNLIMGSPKFEKGFLPRFTQVQELHLEQINLIGTPMAEEIDAPSRTFYINPKYFDWYDTSRVVVEGRPMPIRKFCKEHTVFYCPECERLKGGDGEFYDVPNVAREHILHGMEPAENFSAPPKNFLPAPPDLGKGKETQDESGSLTRSYDTPHGSDLAYFKALASKDS